MSDIVQANLNPIVPAGLSRQASRAIARHQLGSLVRSHAVEDETGLDVDKIESATAITGAAMGAVVRVAQAQQQLELLAPAASARLNLLADQHALDVAQLSSDHQRRLRHL